MLRDIIRIALLALPLILLWYGYVIYAFLRYRFVRQEEIAHVLAAAAESHAPLAPALWAYLHDRPRDDWRRFWLALVMFFVLPGYYFFWRRHNYERKVERLASMLETGYTLHESLRAASGAASREVMLAVAVGESTGQLAPSLRLAPRWRLAPIWLESAPRLLYPVLLLIGVYFVTAFLMVFIVPKFEKMFADFKVKLPWITDFLISVCRWQSKYFAILLVTTVPLVIMVFVSLVSPTIRWYFPILGRLTRMHVQSRLLRMLGLLLRAGKPVPDALGIMADSGYFRGTALYRLTAAQGRIAEGEPLAETLYAVGLLPRSQAALVQAAERAHNLPWALGELGEVLAKRAARLTQRLSFVIFPLAVLAAGLLVGVVAFGMFMPLLSLIARVGR